MKKIVICIICILTVLSFFGCTKGNPINNSSNSSSTILEMPEVSPNEQVAASFGHGMITDLPDGHFIYNGSDIHFQYRFDNGEQECSVALMLFVDGYSQTYFTNENKKAGVLSEYTLKPNESKIIDVYFTPITGKKGQVSKLNINVMLNPSYFPPDDSYVSFDNNHSISQILPQSILFEKDVQNSPKPSDYNYSFDSIDTEILSDKTMNIDENTYLSVSPIDSIELQSGGSEISLTGYGGEETEYRICCFVNHKPILVFNGAAYTDVKISKNQSTKLKITLLPNMINDLKEKNTIYFIAVPINTNNNNVLTIKTDSQILQYIKES